MVPDSVVVDPSTIQLRHCVSSDGKTRQLQPLSSG